MQYKTDLRFGLHLCKLRKQRRLSQEQFAAQLQLNGYDMNRSALAKIESGMRHVYLDDIFAFREVLNISFDDLLNF